MRLQILSTMVVILLSITANARKQCNDEAQAKTIFKDRCVYLLSMRVGAQATITGKSVKNDTSKSIDKWCTCAVKNTEKPQQYLDPSSDCEKFDVPDVVAIATRGDDEDLNKKCGSNPFQAK